MSFVKNKNHYLLKKNNYRPEIDGLRAFAIITVIINHFNKDLLPGGYLGVDIFFVISGYVITSSLKNKGRSNLKDFISEFYERRIKRLVPALSFFVLILSLTICLFHQNHILSIRTGLTSLFGLSNLYLIKQSTNYFAESTDLNVFAHTWSLGVEEQFYLIFPFIIWFSGFGRESKKGSRNLFLIIGALTIASLIGFIYLYEKNQVAAYFFMPLRFWEISTGCLIFLTIEKKSRKLKYIEKVPPFFILGLILIIMYLPISWAAISTFAIVSSTALLIICLKKDTFLFNLFTNSIVVYVGLISYSLYLWHWGVLAISRWTIGIQWWTIPFQIILIIFISLASYKWIETPMRKGKFLNRKLKSFLVCGGMIFITASSLFALEKPLKGKLFLGKINKKSEKNYPKKVECFEEVSNYTNCFYIDNQSNKTLWVVGDSHAAVLLMAAKESSNNLNMNLRLFNANGTPFPPIIHNRKKSKMNKIFSFEELNIFGSGVSDKEVALILTKDFQIVEKKIYNKLLEGDIILISMRLPYHFGGSYYEKPPYFFKLIRSNQSSDWQNKYFKEWIRSVQNLADQVKKIGVSVIIQTPTPEWELETNKYCNSESSQWFNSLKPRDCKIDRKFFLDEKKGKYKDLIEEIKKLSLSRQNIYLLDTFSLVCPEETCFFTIDDRDIYSDDNHLSRESAIQIISPELSEIIKFINKK